VGSHPYTCLTHAAELYAPTCLKVAMVALLVIFTSIDSKAWLIYLQTSLEVFHLLLLWYRKGIEAVGSCLYTCLTHATELDASTCTKVAMMAELLILSSIDSKAWFIYLQTSMEVFHLLGIWYRNDIAAVRSSPYTCLTHAAELNASTCTKSGHGDRATDFVKY